MHFRVPQKADKRPTNNMPQKGRWHVLPTGKRHYTAIIPHPCHPLLICTRNKRPNQSTKKTRKKHNGNVLRLLKKTPQKFYVKPLRCNSK